MYVNRFLFETIHQEYNSSQVKLCNLLYLLTINQPSNSGLVIEMTQEDIADILGILITISYSYFIRIFL